jgi:DNA-binding FadR family transcriptional regulator
MSGNPFLKDFFLLLSDKIRDQLRQDEVQSTQKDLLLGIHKEHEAIFEAISTGDPMRAREITLDHLKNAAKRFGIIIFDSV